MYQKPYRKPAEKCPARKRRCSWCGKVCYPSRGLADKAIKDLTESGRLDLKKKAGALESYPCPKTKCFHVGHNRFKVVA